MQLRQRNSVVAGIPWGKRPEFTVGEIQMGPYSCKIKIEEDTVYSFCIKAALYPTLNQIIVKKACNDVEEPNITEHTHTHKQKNTYTQTNTHTHNQNYKQ